VIRRSLPFDAWPEFDRTAWTEAIAEGDIFDGRGPAAHWAATTRSAVIAAYGRYLSFLAASEPSVLAEHPVERLTEDRLICYLSHLAQSAGTMGRHWRVKSKTWRGSSFSSLDPSARIPVAVLRRRGWRRTVGTPLRGLSRPTISQ
jgi:hypothetical protein